MPDDAGLLLDDSVRDLADDLGIDYKSLFIDLGKATVSGLIGFSTGNPTAFGTAIGDLINAYSAFGKRTDVYEQVGDDPGKLAWLLVHQSLLAAITDLVEDHDARFRAAYQDADELPTEEDIADHLGETLEVTLTDAQIRITPSFFDRPAELDVLEDVQTDLAAWFRAVGVPEGEAGSISRRLPSYFRTALIEEWRAHAEYSRLKEAVDVPFAPAERRAQAWEAYRAYLQKQVDEPVFGEAVSLNQVYIQPRAYVRRPADEEKEDSYANGRAGQKQAEIGLERGSHRRHVSWLWDSVMDWLDGTDPGDAIRIIKGDPGTGKSSFTRMLAAELAADDARTVLFAPLHLLDATKQLQDAIRDFISVPDHPLNGVDPFEDTPLLLILDGLDELSMQGKVGGELAKDFVREIDRTLQRLNRGSISVRVLLSGRKIAADAAASILRDPAKVFNLIPFVPEMNRDKGIMEETYVDPDDLAFTTDQNNDRVEPVDQRDDWWHKYGDASGTDYSQGMPSPLREGRLDDLTVQPLLNYLVALAYEDDPSQFADGASLSTLYEQLLEGVYRRDYDFGPHPGVEVVAGEDRDRQREGFIRVLEEIALDAWHSNSRTTTVASIEERCEKEGLAGLFEGVREKLATGVSQLLAAFYFRKTGQTPQGEATFEFTHKTFAEYLTARRIVRTVEEICEERKRNEVKGGRYGLTVEGALEIWIEVCGPTAMDEDLFEFFGDEIRAWHDEENHAKDVQEVFADLIRYVLQNDVPMHRFGASLVYRTEKVWARNAEEALLAVVRACQLALLADLEKWQQEAGLHAIEVFQGLAWGSAGEWVRRLQSPHSENLSALYSELLSSIIWSERDLSLSILSVSLQNADLRGADLREANLRNANIQRADFRSADLQHARFANSGLQRAVLQGADLRNSDLQNTDLQNTDLRDADLLNADLQGANLQGADLRDANLQNADLEAANLQGAGFRHAHLLDVNLQNAILRSVYLRGVDFRDVNLQRANLQRADLQHADLRSANLRDANLQGANLQRANLQDADLRGVTYTTPDDESYSYTIVESVLINDETRLDDDFRAYIESQNEDG
jgi:uncharacterized protein YjbI with pentapeptide repeats